MSILRKVIVDITKMNGHHGEPYDAYFHQFGNDIHMENDRTFPITYAIVENRETGEIARVDPVCLKFVGKFFADEKEQLGLSKRKYSD